MLILAATVAVITSFELVGNGSPDTTGKRLYTVETEVTVIQDVKLRLVALFLCF